MITYQNLSNTHEHEFFMLSLIFTIICHWFPHTHISCKASTSDTEVSRSPAGLLNPLLGAGNFLKIWTAHRQMEIPSTE